MTSDSARRAVPVRWRTATTLEVVPPSGWSEGFGIITVGGATTVDGRHRTVDEPRTPRQQERHHVGDLTRGADPSQWMQHSHLRTHVRVSGQVQPSWSDQRC